MTISSHALRPFGFIVGPDRAVVVNEVGQVVLNEIFAGTANIDGVPIFEFVLQLVQSRFGDAALFRVLGVFEEDVVPHFRYQLLRSENKTLVISENREKIF